MFMIGINKIYHIDCREFMNKILEENTIKIDAIITSPPYNINKSYSEYNDKRDKNEYLKWLQNVAKKSLEILKEDGSFFLNIGARPTDSVLPFEICKNFMDAGYVLQNTIHWIKSISFETDDIGKNNLLKKDSSIGHFKPIYSKRFLSDLHEYVFHFTKYGNSVINKLAIGVVYQDKSNIGRWKSAKTDKRDRGNVWFIPYNTIQQKGPHPAIFPEKLPRLCIKMHGIKKNTIIYDPFIGVGTTALACIDLDVDFIGTEIDKNYIKIANERIRSKYKRNKY